LEPVQSRALGQLFSQSFRLSLHRFFKLITLYLMLMVPLGVAQMVLSYRAVVSDVALATIFPSLVGLVWPIPRAAVMIAVSDRFTGNTTSIRLAYRIAFHRGGTLIGLGLVIYLLFFLGFVLLVIPGLIVITLFAVAMEAAVFEELTLGAALARSRDLTRGRRLFTLCFLVVLTLTLLVTKGIANAVVQGTFGDASLITTAFDQLTTVLSTLVMGVGCLCLYLHLRAEKEGFTGADLADRVDRVADSLPVPVSARASPYENR